MHPRFSIIIPFYEGFPHIEQCVASVLSQEFAAIEVIIVDDLDPEHTGAALDSLYADTPQVKVLHREQNGGTLQARRDGILAAAGEYILLIDQDDALAVGALKALDEELESNPVDILHFKAKVIAESASAQDASQGMEGFLTPPVRELAGEEILRKQFAQNGGFDWHVHHKAYAADVAKRAWDIAGDVKLALTDDIYLCFILCVVASTYRAVDGAWYEYHLGRGETLGESYSLDKFKKLCGADARAHALMRQFVADYSAEYERPDYKKRLADARDRLVEHSMNEMVDNLDLADRDEAIAFALSVWKPDAVAGELWRYVRDRAYHLLATGDYPKRSDTLHRLVRDAECVDSKVKGKGSKHYRGLRDIAKRHLADLERNAPPLKRLANRFMR